MSRALVALRCLLPVCLFTLGCSPAPEEPDGGAVQPGVDAAALRDASAPVADAATPPDSSGSGADAQLPMAPDAAADSGLAEAADAGADASVYLEVAAELPPNASWSDGGLPPLEVKVCADGDPGCATSRESLVRWTINGAGFTSFAALVGAGQGSSATLVSGPGYLQWGFMVASGTDAMHLASSPADVTLLNYLAPVAFGAVTTLPFVETGLKGEGGRSFLFRYQPFDLKASHGDLHAGLERIASEESAVVGRPVVAFTAFLMPTEIALPLGFEGNISYGNGVVGINYGNPDWVAAMGGAARLIDWEFSHEYAHEHFVEAAKAFAITPTCLNEGLADALGNHLGYVPDSDFCPDNDADGTCDWALGCQAVTEVHAQGNCLLWQFKDAGLLTAAFLAGAYSPQRATYSFDTCDFGAEATGNSYVVYFSEALGAGLDAAKQVTKAGIPNAGSYAAAKAALGW